MFTANIDEQRHMDTIHLGIIGLGANTRLRHVPGFLACEGVEISGVCNRRAESTQAVAEEFGIAKTYKHWEELIADPDIDAVMIGTWPYLHCPITLAALEAGKHVLTEARMAMNAAEAEQMFQAGENRPELVTQIVPSPLGLRGGTVVQEMLAEGFLGDLREVVVLASNDSVADSRAPLHWRQTAGLSGLNMLLLGIIHETLLRWVDDPLRVLAATETFTTKRRDPASGTLAQVGTPDNVRVLTQLPEGACGVYHLSGAIHHGPGVQIHLYGSQGTIKYLMAPKDCLLAGRHDQAELTEVEVPESKAGSWQVEADFIQAIRSGSKPKLTDFATGVRYMQFTEAVARSSVAGAAIDLPLALEE